ncbi:hypothetical protein CK203_068908 [Vitis vinifera]|uniref:Uncharacterized protein n=1 Tax=Vitis vinifera TaxID=29760 RepID=A0A438EXX0_VITVI|nr:hypothetical protein CK203_068908 [Vitis vinifera]
MADINSEVVLGMFLQQLIMETTFMFIVLTLAQVQLKDQKRMIILRVMILRVSLGECVDDEETGSEEIELDFTDNAASENQNPRKRSRDGDNEASGLGVFDQGRQNLHSRERPDQEYAAQTNRA